MKYILLIFISVLSLFCSLSAQPVINKDDMPNIGEVKIYSLTYTTNGVDYSATGSNYSWDFSSLGRATQTTDTFASVSSTPLTYQLVFNLPFDPNKATIAQKEGNFNQIPGLTIEDVYLFYRETSARFVLLGAGLNIQGVPIPAKYNNPEQLYKFPLTVGTTDSSESTFATGIPDLGYFGTTRKRVNSIDGWGTLTTPFGTFQTIRVKSDVYSSDTVYIDSLQQGSVIERHITEYKWLGDNCGTPLLQITEGDIIPFQVMYQDQYHIPLWVEAGNDITINEGESATLIANASGGQPPYSFIWSTGQLNDSIVVSPGVTTRYYITITDSQLGIARDSITVNVIQLPDQDSISIPAGWSGVSSWVIPDNSRIEDLLSPISAEMIIIQSLDEMYWPGQINTIVNWNASDGYMIKMESPMILIINGYETQNKQIELKQGWNLIPVLCTCDVSVAQLFGLSLPNVVLVKEVAGEHLYWPEYLINSLNFLSPSRSYLVKVNNDILINFPQCN